MNALAHPPVSIDTLENAAIDPDVFDHSAHVYAAWLYLEQWPLREATDRFCGALKRLTVKLGAETKYHETITCFFMQLINQRRVATAGANWQQFVTANSELVNDAGKTLARYYRKDLLGSELARQQYLLPDRLVLTDV